MIQQMRRIIHTTHSYTGQTSAGGTAQVRICISVADQEHASDAIAVLDAAIARIDQQRADLGAISNRLSSVVDNNTSMVTNTGHLSHILTQTLRLKQLS